MTHRHTVAVVGAGFGGVSVMDALHRAGIDDVVVIDDRGQIGGSWLDRLDPGARSRGSVSESTLPEHPRTAEETSPFADAMVRYLQRVGEEAGHGARAVAGRVSAAEQAADGSWRLTVTGEPIPGGEEQVTAQFLVLATGLHREPLVPAPRGIDSFAGPLLHTHLWDPGVDLGGSRVAVIAEPSGGHLAATDHVALAAALAEGGATVRVFSQDQPWILPERPDASVREVVLSNPRAEGVARGLRKANRVVREGVSERARTPWRYLEEARRPGPMRWQQAMRSGALLAAEHLDAEQREIHLATAPLARGAVRSEAWFRHVAAGSVDLLRVGIHRVAPDAVVDVNGTRHRVDAIVLATGARPVGPGEGIDGLDATRGGLLADWAGHLGTVGRVPNLFVTGGPASDLPVGGDARVFAARAQLVARLIGSATSRGLQGVVATPAAVERWAQTVCSVQEAAGVSPDPAAVTWAGRGYDLVRALRGDPQDFVMR